MTDKQLEIYKGLKAIGPEIAQFYCDGVQIIESDLGIKSNLLGHILREIDGGLRDIFEQKTLKEEVQKKIKNEELELLYGRFKEDYKNYDYLKDITFADFKEAKGHVSSILVSFGFGFDHPITIQYIKVTRWLAKYAHRSGAYNQPRAPKDIIAIWNEFEDVLSKLIGNYYALADRIDSIISLKEPTDEVLKTLPHLLNTESRFIYFFNELKSSNWITYLERENYFDGSQNPEPLESVDNPGFYSMPFWGVLAFLENVAQQNLTYPNKEITESLVRIIDKILEFRNGENKRIENHRTDYSIFKIICSLPEEYLYEKYFDFIETKISGKWSNFIEHSYNEFLERLIIFNRKDLIVRGVEILLSYRFIEGKFEKAISIFSSFELQRLIYNYKDRLINILGSELLQLCINKMDDIITNDISSFNNISIPAIENHEQTSFPDQYYCQLVYLVRDTLEILDHENTLEILNGFLLREHPIFSRIAFHIIRVRYTEFHPIFWGLKKNPLDFPQTKHEVYELIKEHSSNFLNIEIAQVLEWISSKEYYIPDEFIYDLEKVQGSIAYRKKEWLSALLPSNDESVNTLIIELNEINSTEVEHAGFDSWHSSFWGNTSPLTAEEINNQSIEETIIFYNDFNSKNHDFLGPSTDGLIDMLIHSIRNNPDKYIYDCEPFIDAPSQIRYAWIRGLGECWHDEKTKFDCSKIFNTIIQIIEKPDFWEIHNSGDNHNRWFISNLLSFIENGLRNDNHAFDPTELPIIKKIIFNIHQNDKQSIFDHRDLSITVLNNTKGKLFMVLFQYSLRLARLEGKTTNRWDIDIKELISQKIELIDDNPLLFYVVGQFLPNIHYLDENWMINNFNKLFPLQSKANWSAALSGYFFHHRQPNKILLQLFIDGSHLNEVISNDQLFGDTKSNLIQQLCIAYLCEFEQVEINSKILQSLIHSDNESVFSSMIHFFWSPNFPFEKSLIPKIKPLWIELYNRAIKSEKTDIDKYILSGCCKWLNCIEEIDDEILEVIVNSAKFINQRDRHAIIESLSKHLNNYPEKVGLILIALFENEVVYDISQEKLKGIIEILYEKGFKELADKICLIHGEYGFHFLRSFYIKYNV